MEFQIDQNEYEACPEFNLWLDERHGEDGNPILVFGLEPRPSLVLHAHGFQIYKDLFVDFQEDYEQKLKQRVIDDFPAPIAHPFYRFEKGAEHERQRLEFLRDTWEGLVDVLHALALSELRSRGTALEAPLNLANSCLTRFLPDSRPLSASWITRKICAHRWP